nr:YlbD family protein [uncultured Bacillus sp.]
MTTKKLDPSIEEFKKFVTKNPKIIDEVRIGKATLQELYEDWYLLGEEDPRWERYRSEIKSEKNTIDTQGNWLNHLLGTVKKMDPNQIQGHLGQLSQALGAIQEVIGQFQGGAAKQGANRSKPTAKHPFQFRKD